jgi:hypothetical protein
MTANGKARASEYLAGAVMVFTVWFLTWTWPLWLWCLGAFLGAWLIHKLRMHYRGDDSISPAWTSQLFQSMTKEGRDALLAITAGCLLVTVFQFVLRLCRSIASEQTVRSGEYYLSDLQHRLAAILSVPVVAGMLAVSVSLSVIFPRLRLTRLLINRKKLVSKALITLTAACSFTFFGSTTLAVGERNWVASRRSEFDQALKKIGEARRELVAAESVRRTLSTSTPGFRSDLRQFVTEASARSDAEIIAEGAAERLARQAPPLREARQDKDREGKETILDGVIDDVRIWTGGGSAGRAPSLSDLQFLAKTADRLDSSVNEAHAAIADIVKTAAGGLLPGHADPFVRLFAKSLVGAVARQSMESVFPRNVSDLRTAALWMDLATGEVNA